MILSFSSHGKGGGNGPVSYVVNEVKPSGEKRTVKPEILHGDAELTKLLIDSNKNSYKYTSLVISFTKEEFSKDLASKILEEFEKFAFAGLDKKDYEFLAVLHKDTNNPHIHIITPRKHLTKDIDLNIAPPHQQKQWHLFSDYIRDKYNLKQIKKVNDLDKSVLTKNEKKAIFNNKNLTHTTAKIELDKFIKENVLNDLVQNRRDIINLLKSIECVENITEKNKFISLKIKGIDKNIRLSGGIYERTITTIQAKRTREQDKRYSNRYFNESVKVETARTKQQDQIDNRRTDRSIEERFKRVVRDRVKTNKTRYKTTNKTDNNDIQKLFSAVKKEASLSQSVNSSKQHIINNSSINNSTKITNDTAEQIESLKNDLLNPNLTLAQKSNLINSINNLMRTLEQENRARLKI